MPSRGLVEVIRGGRGAFVVEKEEEKKWVRDRIRFGGIVLLERIGRGMVLSWRGGFCWR